MPSSSEAASAGSSWPADGISSITPTGLAVGNYGSEHTGRDVCAFDRNLYWNASGKPVLFGPMTFAQWQATGQDKESRVADPLFQDPAKGDFRLRQGSPAAQVGFEAWDFSTVGPRPSEAK